MGGQSTQSAFVSVVCSPDLVPYYLWLSIWVTSGSCPVIENRIIRLRFQNSFTQWTDDESLGVQFQCVGGHWELAWGSQIFGAHTTDFTSTPFQARFPNFTTFACALTTQSAVVSGFPPMAAIGGAMAGGQSSFSASFFLRAQGGSSGGGESEWDLLVPLTAEGGGSGGGESTFSLWFIQTSQGGASGGGSGTTQGLLVNITAEGGGSAGGISPQHGEWFNPSGGGGGGGGICQQFQQPNLLSAGGTGGGGSSGFSTYGPFGTDFGGAGGGESTFSVGP